MIQFPLPLIGLCAYSGTGKTTLLTQLIPILKNHNLRIAVIKHAHHKFDIDHPGKDSYKFRQAGAEQIVVASKKHTVRIQEHGDGRNEPVLSDALATLDTSTIDLVIVEGFKRDNFPKIELHRAILGHPLLYKQDASIIALATDAILTETTTPPLLNVNKPCEIADFIVSHIKKFRNKTTLRTING